MQPGQSKIRSPEFSAVPLETRVAHQQNRQQGEADIDVADLNVSVLLAADADIPITHDLSDGQSLSFISKNARWESWALHATY